MTLEPPTRIAPPPWRPSPYGPDDRLTRIRDAEGGELAYFGYDKTGSCVKLVTGAHTSYFAYNAANLVESVVTPEHTTYFLYDGNLQRYAIVEDGVATYYLWDGLRLLETRNADGSLKARFTHGRASIEAIGSYVEIYVPSGAKQYYMLIDHRGSAHVLLDESKSVVASRLYTAFGEWVAQTGTWPVEVPFGYQSNWLYLCDLPDGSPLYLSPTRVYHAGVGRYLQRDPIGTSVGMNLYEYVGSAATEEVDALGLMTDADAKALWAMRQKLADWHRRLKRRIKDDPFVEFCCADVAVRLGDSIAQLQAVVAAHNMGKPISPRSYGVGQGILDFVRGAADSLTFGGTKYVREWIHGDAGQVLNETAYVAGEWTEVGLELTIFAGGALLRRGVAKAAQRTAAKTISKAARKRFARDLARRGISRIGKRMHHVHAVLGHPAIKGGRGAVRSLFPAGRLGAAARWNLRLVTKARHLALHARAYRAELALYYATHPALTGMRAALNLFRDTGPELETFVMGTMSTDDYGPSVPEVGACE